MVAPKCVVIVYVVMMHCILDKARWMHMHSISLFSIVYFVCCNLLTLNGIRAWAMQNVNLELVRLSAALNF